jgi:methyl-accepting chemotaxis protein
MTIGKKLYVGFATILALVVLLFFANVTMLQREHAARSAADSTLRAIGALGTVRFQIMQDRLFLQNYLLSGDTRETDNLKTGMVNLADDLRLAQSLVSSGDAHPALTRVESAEQEWFTNFASPLIDKRRQVDSGHMTVAELQIAYLQQNPSAWLKKSTDPLDLAESSIKRTLDESLKLNETAVALTTSVSVTGMLLAGILGLGIAYYTAKSITVPLNRLITVAREIGDQGNLDHQVDIQRNDEIGELSRTFNNMVSYLREMAGVSEAIAGGDLNVEIRPRSRTDMLAHAFMRMVEGLRTIVRSVRDSAAQVASGSEQMADASDGSAKISGQASAAIDEVTTTMQEMSINVQSMVRSTQVQASSVSETSASIEEMVASIQRVADTATVLLDISNRSREEVRNGIGTMEKTTDGLKRIHEAIQQGAEVIKALDARAENIGRIVEVIDDLAEQTNLLALNAAIEAARAGEHGLGFAVVADEVRKLAEKSAASTKEIAELIQSIQREARGAVDKMGTSTSIVNQGLQFGDELSGALKKISSVVIEVNKFAQEIGAATNEQSRGSAQIAKATTRLNEITHEINSAVEEQAAGAQAVTRAMEKMRELMQQSTAGSTELAASSEQMSKMARALLAAMDRFVLEPALGGAHRSLKHSAFNEHEAMAARTS